MKETQKQLHNLIRAFYDASEARHITGQIEEADRMMAAFESPLPRKEVTERIKQKIRQRAAARQRRTMVLRSMVSAAAACLLIGAGLFWFLSVRHLPSSSMQTADLGPDAVKNFFTDQPVEEIASSLDEISSQLYAINISGWDSIWEEERRIIEEIEEMDLLTDNDFWKG